MTIPPKLTPIVAAAAAILASASAHASVAQIYIWNDETGTDQTIMQIANTSAFALTNLTLTGTGYQGARLNLTSTTSLSDVGAGATVNFTGGSLPFSSGGFADYDDIMTGNFSLHLTGLWNGQAVVADFAPNNNLTAGFVGFLSMDVNGNDFESNTSSTTVMANIDLQVSPVPEPTSALSGAALIGVIGLSRLRRSRPQIQLAGA